MTTAFTPGGSGRDHGRGRRPRERADDPGTIPDVHYDFTQFGLDRSQSPRAENLRTSLIVDPPGWAVTRGECRGPETSRRGSLLRRSAWVAGGIPAEANQLDDRCIIMAGVGPPMLNTGYNSNYQIVQAPGYVMILTEMIHDARVIPLDGADRPQPGCASGWGCPGAAGTGRRW